MAKEVIVNEEQIRSANLTITEAMERASIQEMFNAFWAKSNTKTNLKKGTYIEL